MKITINNYLSDFTNYVLSDHTYSYLVDLLSITAIAKYVSPSSILRDIDDFNEIVYAKYPELIYEGKISHKHISILNEMDLSPKEIRDFLFTLLPKIHKGSSGVFDFPTKYARELSQMVTIPKEGDIASLNCSGISIFREIIRQNNFKGNIHLYLYNKNDLLSLRVAFLHIYPLNQNITLHLGVPETRNLEYVDMKHFDFIYSMPPMGLKRDDLIENNLDLANIMLKQNGSFFLLVPSGLLSTKNHEKTRYFISNWFDIDAIFSLSQAFRPFSGIDSAILLLRKMSNQQNNIFIAHLNFLHESAEDISYAIEKYHDFKSGESSKSVSPIINQVTKDEIREDFNVLRFDPKLQNLRMNVLEKYDLKMLNELCDIIKSTSTYSSKEYQNTFFNDGLKYIRITDIKDGTIDSSSVKWVERKKESEVLTQPGDILFSVTGTVGKIGLIDEDSANSLISNSLVILRPYKNIVDRDYIILALQSDYCINQILGNSAGTMISHLALGKIRSLEIPYLEYPKQQDVVESIKMLQEEAFELKRRLDEIESEIKLKINNLFE